MKSIILICSLILFLIAYTSCSFENEYKQFQDALKPQTVFVIVSDDTKSVIDYWNLDTKHLERIYQKLGASREGVFYGLFIKSNSLKQEPIKTVVSALDTLPLRGNAIQQANRQRINIERVKSFNARCPEFISITSKLIGSKNDDWSDVENALNIAKQIMEMPNYESWNKIILIISDLENNLPPTEELDKMIPIIFEDDVNIAVVRPSEKINLQEVLPGATPYITIDDAIESIFNKKGR